MYAIRLPSGDHLGLPTQEDLSAATLTCSVRRNAFTPLLSAEVTALKGDVGASGEN